MKKKNLLLILILGIIFKLWDLAINAKLDLLNNIEEGYIVSFYDRLFGSEFLFLNIMVVIGLFSTCLFFKKDNQ